MTKQQLATKLWNSANKLRSKIDANEYKDYILGFIFYKYLSEKEVKFLKENDYAESDIMAVSESDEDTRKFLLSRIGYFISYKNLFSTWIKDGSDFGVERVNDALSDFSRLLSPDKESIYGGIFETLSHGIPRLGSDSKAQTQALTDLIYLIDDIPMTKDDDYDVLGFVYEYLIGMFAANAGKKAGEFYTPHEVSTLMADIIAEHLDGRESMEVYDPTSGSGSLLITIGKAISKRNKNKNAVRYYAQELKRNTYDLTRMNLVMRDINPDDIVVRNGDTLKEDWPWFDDKNPSQTYSPLFIDAVVSNPPYSQHWIAPEDQSSDLRFSDYGIAPATKADYAFLLHCLYHLKDDGIMTIVLPHGVLFRGGEEAAIRQKLLERAQIDTIIGLPSNIFFGTGIPTIIMVLKKKRDNSDVLIIDASQGFEKVGKNNKLRSSDIKRIADTIRERKDVPKYARVVSLDEIRENDFNLNIPRYVDSSAEPETWDTFASIFGGFPPAEIDALNEYWAAFPSLRAELFKEGKGAYPQLTTDNIKAAIIGNADVKTFKSGFEKAFVPFRKDLKHALIDDAENVDVSAEEEKIAEKTFAKLASIPLVDKYAAFQIIDDQWQAISADLELIHSEGMKCCNEVTERIVIKKKDGKEYEVADGFIGRIIPFELVQSEYMTEKADEIDALDADLSEVSGEIDGIIESFTEDEISSNDGLFKDDNQPDFSKIAKEVKDWKKKKMDFEEDSFEARCVKMTALLEKEKTLTKELRVKDGELTKLTCEKIHSLSTQEVAAMLEKKWIAPILEKLNAIPDGIIDELSAKIKSISEKYSDTYESIENQISTSQSELSKMLGDLEGDSFDQKAIAELKQLLEDA